MRTRALSLSLPLLVAAASAGCAASSTASPNPSGSPARLTVLAAASLTTVLPRIGAAFAREHPGVTFGFSFAGTDQLAAQIQQGAPADVFAGASTRYGDQLAGSNLIEPFGKLCTNRLVLVVPSSNPAGIASIRDLASRPVKLVIGSETVPVGSYTRTVLGNLDAIYGQSYSSTVLAKVVSDEDSVTSILTKVESGEADAGFVYVTDARAAGDQVRAFALPSEAQAVATYPIAVVRSSRHAALARQFVAFALTAPAQRLLRRAGFGPPPAS